MTCQHCAKAAERADYPRQDGESRKWDGTLDALKEIIHYEPSTGAFTWKVRPPQSRRPGNVAGYFMRNGYYGLTIGGDRFYGHRLAYFYMHGIHPAQHIDHINGIKTDNRIENLRDVPRNWNIQNVTKAPRHSAVGLLGVYRNKKKFGSKIKKDGVVYCLGSFDTPEEAHAVYVAAKRRLHPGAVL